MCKMAHGWCDGNVEGDGAGGQGSTKAQFQGPQGPREDFESMTSKRNMKLSTGE